MLLQARLSSLSSAVEQQVATRALTWTRKVVVGVLATLFIALCAHISVDNDPLHHADLRRCTDWHGTWAA